MELFGLVTPLRRRLVTLRAHVPSSWLVVAAAVALASGTPHPDAQARAAQPARRRPFAAATQHPLATRAAMDVLEAGGSAVDGAIAAALTLGVVEPDCSGLGGGGFALVWDAHRRRTFALDFRESAPSKLDVARIEAVGDDPPKSMRGVLAGVPGELAGLAELHARLGRLAWGDDVAPAAHVAEQGFSTTDALARNAYEYAEEVSWAPSLRSIFEVPVPVWVGRAVRRPGLAATLRRIQVEGPRAFYEGPVAREIVEAVAAAGGTISERDLATYRPVERTPLHVAWEGLDVLTMPPPSAGGLLLAETLKLTSKRELASLGLGSGAYVHLLAEAFRGAMADRVRNVGDPAYVRDDTRELIDGTRLHARRTKIQLDRTQPLPSTPIEEHGTSHLVVVDGDGDVVSLTTTVGDAFGSRVATATSGVVMNDELVDFTRHALYDEFDPPRAGRRWPTRHVAPNAPRPGARPVSSMTPTIAFEAGVPVLAVGGAGGLRIPTAVAQAFLARTVFGRPPSEAVAMRRFHTPFDGPTLELEEGTAAAVVDDVHHRGEQTEVVRNYSAVQMIAIDRGPSGTITLSGGADPRYGGAFLAE